MQESRDRHPGAGTVELSNIGGVLFDIDGVLHRGWTVLPGAPEIPATLERLGLQFICVTNNASRTPENVAEELTRIGIATAPHQVMTSAEATSLLLRKRAPAGTTIFAIGMRGLYEPLFDDGYFVLQEQQPDYVVVGADFDLTYEKLKKACLAIRGGARFIGTNPDTTFPTVEGLIPGAGSILALLVAATGVTPEIVGKPAPALFDAAIERMALPREQVVMVGDRLDTDIAGAHGAGLRSIFVGTGVNSAAEAATFTPAPDAICADMHEVLALLGRRG